MSDLESHEEVSEQIENFSKDEVELKLGNTFSNTKDLSLDLSYRRLVFDNDDDHNKIDFSKPAEMELSHSEESFKVSFGGKDDEIHILAGIRYENNKEGVDEDSQRQCLLIYDENTHTWTLECIDYNYNVGPDGDYGSDIDLDDFERHFETSMKYDDDIERQFETSMKDEFAEEFDANAEDIEDEFIEGYNGNGITNGIHDDNGYEGGNSDDEVMEDDAFVEVENPLQPYPPGVNNVNDEEIIKNDSESSDSSSSGSSSSSASGSESGDEDGSDSGSELGSDLGDLEASLEAQLTEAPNNDTVKTNGVNRKTNPSTGRPEGPISLAELFGGTGNENDDDESGSSSA
ncbi:28525_t:CDS:2, partial [Dentiscutata erythropus]